MSLYDLLHSTSPNVRFFGAKTLPLKELAMHGSALANGGGGMLIFGISPENPRQVVGTSAYHPYEPVRQILQAQLPVRIDARTYEEHKKRVLVFTVAARPIGVPIPAGGICWGYEGDRLVPLSLEGLQHIEAESGPDFTAGICAGATMEDLDMDAVSQFLALRQEHRGSSVLDHLSREDLLKECGAVSDEGISYAALILFGTKAALEKYLPACATIFDFRYHETDFPVKKYQCFRSGLFSFYKDIRGLLFNGERLCDHADGFDFLCTSSFDLDSTVQLFLNAVCHRDYQAEGHIEIKMNWKEFTIQSPGGFPEGTTADNLKTRQHPRNPLLAKLLTLSGLTEYSGQGLDIIYTHCLREAKALPDYSASTSDSVVCTLRSAVSDEKLLLTMHRFDFTALSSLPYEALQVLCLLYRREPIPESLQDYVDLLADWSMVSRSNGHTSFVSPSTFRASVPPSLEEAILEVLSQAEQGLSTKAIREALTYRWEEAVQKALEEMQKSGSVCCLKRRYSSLWFAR